MKTQRVNTARSFDKFSFPGRYTKGDPYFDKVARELFERGDMASVMITYFCHDTWYRAQSGLIFQVTSLENMIYRRVVQEENLCEIQDVLNHVSYRFISLRMDTPMIRYIAAVPILDPNGIAAGAILLLDNKRNRLTSEHANHLIKVGKDLIVRFNPTAIAQAPK